MASFPHRNPLPSRPRPVTAQAAKIERDRRLVMTIAVSGMLVTATAIHALLQMAL